MLITPILFSQDAFDANSEHNFTFSVSGGTQIVKNKLTIIRQIDNVTVYSREQSGYTFYHTVPAQTLENGVYYFAYLNTFDADNNISANSNSIQFYCYTTPIYNITNIPTGNIISNSNYVFTATYNQAENELLNSYEFNLYDSQQILIATSGVKYTTTASVPIEVSHEFTGLTDNSIYYIEALGETIEGTQIFTSRLYFAVRYEESGGYSVIELTNNCKDGYILFRSALSPIEGITSPDPPIYVYDDTAISLVNAGDYVKWYTGFALNSNFTASLWGENFNLNSTIATLKDSVGRSLKVNFIKDTDGYYYAQLIAESRNVIYEIYSEPVALEDANAPIQIWFRRIDNLFSIGINKLQ